MKSYRSSCDRLYVFVGDHLSGLASLSAASIQTRGWGHRTHLLFCMVESLSNQPVGAVIPLQHSVTRQLLCSNCARRLYKEGHECKTAGTHDDQSKAHFSLCCLWWWSSPARAGCKNICRVPRARTSHVDDFTQGGHAGGEDEGEAAAERGEGDRVRHEPGPLRGVPVEAAPLEQPAPHARVLQPARPGQDHRRCAVSGRRGLMVPSDYRCTLRCC